MNSWRSRTSALALMLGVMQVHSKVTQAVPNTPGGMLVFHLSAGFCDALLIHCAPYFLSGPLCDDTQRLCLLSIVANFLGWLLYLAYAPPELFNTFMWGLSLVQSIRLFIVDSGDADHLGLHLVRGPRFLGA